MKPELLFLGYRYVIEHWQDNGNETQLFVDLTLYVSINSGLIYQCPVQIIIQKVPCSVSCPTTLLILDYCTTKQELFKPF